MDLCECSIPSYDCFNYANYINYMVLSPLSILTFIYQLFPLCISIQCSLNRVLGKEEKHPEVMKESEGKRKMITISIFAIVLIIARKCAK